MNHALTRIQSRPEHRRRGLLAASFAVPVAAVVWASLQYASSLTAVLVGLMGGATAVCFFRLASGGAVSRGTVPRLVVVATASAAIAIGIVFALQMTEAWVSVTGGAWFAAAVDPVFWSGSAAVATQTATFVDIGIAMATAAATCAALLLTRPRSVDSESHLLALLARPTV